LEEFSDLGSGLETEFKEVYKDQVQKDRNYVRDVEVETDVEMLIPDDYINNIQERLLLYTQLDSINDEEKLTKFIASMEDRFGPIPKPVNELFDGLRVRWICKKLGFERLSLKSNKLRCYFIGNPQSSFFESELFQSILQYVSVGGQLKGYTLKQSRNYLLLIKEGVTGLKKARVLLQELHKEVTKD